jgi:hypothetical protein
MCGLGKPRRLAPPPGSRLREHNRAHLDFGNGATSSATEFAPAAVPEGYTRIVAPTLAQIPPGGDVIRCQYVLAPLDRDMDVLDVRGYQSKGGIIRSRTR